MFNVNLNFMFITSNGVEQNCKNALVHNKGHTKRRLRFHTKKKNKPRNAKHSKYRLEELKCLKEV